MLLRIEYIYFHLFPSVRIRIEESYIYLSSIVLCQTKLRLLNHIYIFVFFHFVMCVVND